MPEDDTTNWDTHKFVVRPCTLLYIIVHVLKIYPASLNLIVGALDRRLIW